MAKLAIRARAVEAFESGEEFRAFDRRMHRLLDEQITELKDLAVDLLQEAAPEGSTKRLKRGIRARKQIRGRPGFDITIHARDPQSGYDYAAVTRFGHIKTKIRSTRGTVVSKSGKPTPARLRVTWNHPRNINRGRAGAQTILSSYFTEVSGVGHGRNPIRDWAFDALDEVQASADYVANRLSSRLNFRVFTG